MIHPVQPEGYSLVGPGMVANVVTCLEMLAPPARVAVPVAAHAPAAESGLVLAPWQDCPVEAYRALYRAIGTEWLWFSRLAMPDEKLAAILADPKVDLFRLADRAGRDLGLLELDFRSEGACELAFFGLVPDAIGTGAGRYLMEEAIARAWSRLVDGRHIRRFWVHTCTFDHPRALGFYRRAGFVPYAFMVEAAPDPRLTGHLPRTAAPHVPLLEDQPAMDSSAA